MWENKTNHLNAFTETTCQTVISLNLSLRFVSVLRFPDPEIRNAKVHTKPPTSQHPKHVDPSCLTKRNKLSSPSAKSQNMQTTIHNSVKMHFFPSDQITDHSGLSSTLTPNARAQSKGPNKLLQLKMTPGVVSLKQIQTKTLGHFYPPFKRKANRMISPLRSSPKAAFTAFLSHPHSKLETEPNDDERKMAADKYTTTNRHQDMSKIHLLASQTKPLTVMVGNLQTK